MKVLVYGAGNIGCLYAARLHQSGHDVSLVARGARLEAIREYGVRLENAATGERSTHRVRALDTMAPSEPYDLVIVALSRPAVSHVLPVLAEHRGSPNVLFFGNRASGPDELVQALGRERVLLGFPGAAAIERDGQLRYVILSAREQPTTLGELDGLESGRIDAIVRVMESTGFPASVSSNMDAWLKTHAAEIAPTAGALYACDGDLGRLTRTRDALVLMLRAIREGYGVLEAHGIPLTPSSHRVFRWVPEPLLVAIARGMLADESTTIKVGHAHRARGEMRELFEDLHALASGSSGPTAHLDRLRRFVDPATPVLADGEAKIPLSWKGVALAGALLLLASGLIGWLTGLW